jgi:cytidylate kinase
MIIAISGYSGCGKNTVGRLVAEKLGLREVKFSFKDEAEARHMSLVAFQKLATRDASIDKAMDECIVREAKRGNCVLTTWLGPWLAGATLRVWLNASLEDRARRVAQRDGMQYPEALAHVKWRDGNNRKRYRKYYGIDISNHEMFDMVINSSRFTPQQSADIIALAASAIRYG